jgi:lysophospholipase L1-like esterase
MSTIVCLGDSITCEWEEPHYPTYWQKLCDEQFDRGKYKIIAAGVNGETAADGFLRLDANVLQYDPDIVTLMFGHNDIHQGLSPIRFQENLGKIIDYLQAKSSASLWLLTPNQISDVKVAKLYQPYLALIKSLAQVKKITYVDL